MEDVPLGPDEDDPEDEEEGPEEDDDEDGEVPPKKLDIIDQRTVKGVSRSMSRDMRPPS